MLSKTTLKAFSLLFQTASTCKSIPFVWNPKSGVFQSSVGAKHRRLFLLNVFLDFCYQAVAACISLHMILKSRHDVSNLGTLLVYLFASIIFSSLMMLSLIWYEAETLEFANMLLRMDSDMVNSEIPKSTYRENDSPIVTIICVGFIAVQLFSTLAMMLILMRPNAFENFYLYVGGRSLAGQLLISICQGLIVFNSWNVVLFFAFLGFGFLRNIAFWLSTISDNLQNEGLSFEEGTKLYRSLRLMNIMFHNAMSPLFLPVAKVTLSSFIIVSLFCLVMYNTRLYLLLAVVFICFGLVGMLTFFLFIGMAIQVCQKSNILLSVLQVQSATILEGKVFRSLPILHVHVGPFYAYNRGTLLTLYRYSAETSIALMFLHR